MVYTGCHKSYLRTTLYMYNNNNRATPILLMNRVLTLKRRLRTLDTCPEQFNKTSKPNAHKRQYIPLEDMPLQPLLEYDYDAQLKPLPGGGQVTDDSRRPLPYVDYKNISYLSTAVFQRDTKLHALEYDTNEHNTTHHARMPLITNPPRQRRAGVVAIAGDNAAQVLRKSTQPKWRRRRRRRRHRRWWRRQK